MHLMFTEVKNCRCCNSSDLHCVMDLQPQPLANSYHDGHDSLINYPLIINVCKNCFHTQLSGVVDPDEMFLNYLYVSGTSKTLHEYFEWFVRMVEADNLKGKILDIACNDGTQLSKFKNNNWITHGVDPAKNLAFESSTKCDKIVVDYFNKNCLKNLDDYYDAIIAQNVFAHTHDVYNFLLCCKELMKNHSILYIQTSQADMIENNQFDTIYHEHLSFFSTLSMKTLCERVGLYLVDVQRVNIHGGSYIFKISKQNKIKKQVEESLLLEKNKGRYDLNTYITYANNVKNIIENTKEKINWYLKNGYIVVGYGAAAKGNTFLNSSAIKLHYIIDDNTLKQNLLTPGSNTLIVSKDFIKKFANNTVFIPLAWNFYDEISKTIKIEVNKLQFKKLYNYDIISFFPKLEVEHI